MSKIRGLAVFIIISGGIIIQYEGTPVRKSQNLPHDPRKLVFSDDIIENIIVKSNFETLKTIAKTMIIRPSHIKLSELLGGNPLVLIDPEDNFKKTDCVFYVKNEPIIRTGSYARLLTFFNEFGGQITRIKIIYQGIDDEHRKEIHNKIIKEYSHHLTELQIRTDDDENVWNDLSDKDGNDIVFSNVKKFKFMGKSNRNEFKLDLIFPKLKSITLRAEIKDANCLSNVKALEELELDTNSIRDHELISILKNNKKMSKITFHSLRETSTMELTAEHSKKFETLELIHPSENLLSRTNNRDIYTFSSVKHFILSLQLYRFVIEIAFNMPQLKKLSCILYIVNDETIDFIEHFRKLKTVELIIIEYEVLNTIKYERIKNNFEGNGWIDPLSHEERSKRKLLSFKRQPC